VEEMTMMILVGIVRTTGESARGTIP